MTIQTLVLPPIGTNCYILTDEESRACAIVDPASEVKKILSAVGDRLVRYVLLTHGHFDHIGAVDDLIRATGAELIVGEEDRGMLSDPHYNASRLFSRFSVSAVSPARTVKDGDVLPFPNGNIRVIATPGHTAGSVCYACGEAVFTGDTLFADGYGRLDLPGALPDEMPSSLEKIKRESIGKTVYPGHGQAGFRYQNQK